VNNSYSKDSAFNLKLLIHDLRGLLTPMSTSLHCIKIGEHADGVLLQEEVLKRLRMIVDQLEHDSSLEGSARSSMEQA